MNYFIKFLQFLLLILSFTDPLLAKAVIQPGDQVRLRIVGILDKSYEVSPDGNIDFDLWGTVNLQGKDHDQAIAILKKSLRKYIRIRKNHIFLSIKKKIIKKNEDYISVFGEVRSSGSYPFQKSWKVLDYIMLSGGTTRFALTDSIKVICGQKKKTKVSDFNMQRFATGEPTHTPSLHPGCVIYVPEKPASKASWLRNRPNQVVHILGQINKPGRYEFTEEFGFLDIFSHAGGPTIQANTRGVTIISKGKVSHFNLENYLRNGGKLPKIETEDVIYVPERPSINASSWTKISSAESIYLLGEVKNPGRYDFNSSLNFMDILAQAGGPAQMANLSQVAIISKGKVTIFDLKKYLTSGGALPVVKTEDILFIPPLSNNETTHWTKIPSNKSIYLIGEVTSPGRYDYTPSIGFLDLLAQTGGPTPSADIKRITLIRSDKTIAVFNLYSFQKGEEVIPRLYPGDTIYFASIDPQRWVKRNPTMLINVMGAVVNPGRYEIEPENMNIIDILAATNGPTDTANLSEIKILHRSVFKDPHSDQPKIETILFNFEEFQETGDVSILPMIRLGDTIVVPPKEISFWKELKTIGGTLGVMGALWILLL